MVADTQLDTLEAKGLIRLAALQPELEYLFRHWLVQDAAYGSLLRQERKQLHGDVGEALEALYPDRRSELAGVLAMHFEEAGEIGKALVYLVAAGKFGLERNALQESFSAFDRAARLLPEASADDDDAARRMRVEIQFGRARSSWTFRPIGEVIAEVEAILDDAEKVGDLELLAQIHLHLALARLQTGDTATNPAVKRSLDRVAEIAAALGDSSLMAMPLAMSGLMHVFGGPIREGVETLEQAVPMMEGRQDFIGAAFARGALAIGYANLGEFAKADAAAKNATEIAMNGDLIAQLDAQIAESWVRSAEGKLDEAMPLARACIDRAEETGASACVMASSWILGDLYHRQGRFEEARATLQRGTDISMVVDRNAWRPTLLAWLNGAAAALGDPTEEGWDEALATATMIGNRLGAAGILWKRGESRAQSGRHAEAIADFEASVEILEDEGARPNLARVLRSLGESLRAAGRTAEAERTLRRSLALFEELGIDGEAGIVRTLLTLGETRIAFD